jgi:cardiolipin synthase
MAELSAQPVFTVADNRLTMLDTGPRRLDALLALIDGAERTLRMIYYIYADDETGARVLAALIAACERGVAVALIVDGLGSDPAANARFFDPLAAAGASVCVFVPRFGRRYLLRNHQKIALADEARIIIGGFNIEDDYFGTPAQAAWRDLGLLVDGPAAARLAGYFDALSRWARQPKAPMRELRAALSQWSEPPGGAVRWLLGGPTRRLSPWARAVKRDMQRAHRIDIIAGYFVPNPAMLRRLDKAAKRGQVRVVVPSVTDNYATLWATRFTYAGLLRKDVHIFEYLPTKLHTKLFVIDDAVQIGSANFDVRSMFLNLEVMLRIEDSAFAAHVRRYVDGEVARSEEITRDVYRTQMTWWRRLRQMGAYFIVAVLDLNISRRLNFEPPKRRR